MLYGIACWCCGQDFFSSFFQLLFFSAFEYYFSFNRRMEVSVQSSVCYDNNSQWEWYGEKGDQSSHPRQRENETETQRYRERERETKVEI